MNTEPRNTSEATTVLSLSKGVCENGYIESFNARLKEECLNREELWILTEARVVIEDWRWK
jgi:hypothetical protein